MAYKRKIQCNCIIFYGIRVSIGELQNKAKSFGYDINDFKEFVTDNNLELGNIGSAEQSADLIVGKEINNKQTFSTYVLQFNDKNEMSLNQADGTKINIKLSQEEEYQITRKLHKCGLLFAPKYYMFHNYIANR